MSVHEGGKLGFQCSICSVELTSKRNLDNHVLSVHEGKFKCLVCNVELSSKRNLENHIKSVHEGKKVNFAKRKSKDCDIDNITIKQECLDSSEELDKEKLLPLLTKTEPPNSDDSEEYFHEWEKIPYQCLFCDKNFSTLHYMNRHVQNVHEEGKKKFKHKCSLCDATFRQKSDVKKHVNTVHEGVKPEKRKKNKSVQSKKIVNKITRKNLDINEEFNDAHMINIKKEPLEDDYKNLDYQCSICLATFSQKSKLKRHMTLTHKVAKKKIELSKIDRQNVSNSNKIHKNQISNEEFLDPNRINIKEEPLDENYDMNTDVFLPDPVKIEPTDENFYDDYDDDPLAS